MERSERHNGIWSSVLAFVLGFGACAGTVRLLLPEPVQATSRTVFATADPAAVADAVRQTVVALEVYPQADADSPWQRLLSDAGLQPAGPSSVASGVVISRDGHVVTNHHAVSGAGRVRVRLPDGREFDARKVGGDPQTDLAVLKLPAGGLKAAVLADSRRARPGDPVLAVGNPLGFENSVTLGVVSANRRGPIRVQGIVMGDVIQTDAAINQGNSGGGLFTADGRLLGINTAIMVPRGGSGNIGIGFAIPAHRVEPVTRALMSGRKVPRPWLGIRYELPTVNSLVRRLRAGSGVLVDDVIDGSPAARAGIRPADVIRQLGEAEIRNPDDLFTFIERHRPGERVAVRIVREGSESDTTLVLGDLPE